MVGKLNLDLGDDYAFDPRRAKEVAEGATPQQPVILGPFTANGTRYWLDTVKWNVWFDIDGDPLPDLAVPLKTFLDNAGVDPMTRSSIRRKARDNGWQE